MDWIDDILNTTVKHYNGRQIVLWGKYSVTEEMKARLQDEYGIEDVCYIESNPDAVDQQEVFETEYIAGKKESCYVVVTLAVYEYVRGKLIGGGYEPTEDYYYFTDCVVKCTDEYYEDAHGNRFIGKRDGIRFCFSGWNAVIKIEEGAKYDEGLSLYLHNNEVFELGENSDVRGCFLNKRVSADKIQIGRNAVLQDCNLLINGELIIGDDVQIWSRKNQYQAISVCRKGKVQIGQGTTIAPDFLALCARGKQIIIGKDCMFSWGERLLPGDSHTIFDVKSGEAVNKHDKEPENSIMIGDHVWIGMRCNILYGTKIGDGSIVGMGSTVKGIYPNNCTIAGSIARIIKRDVAWCREDGAHEIERCGEYVRVTENL